VIIKVCGVRTVDVAEAAAEAGADWLGLVFAPGSIREISSDQAAAIRDAMSGRVRLVGVLVDSDAGTCNRLAERFRLDAVQLHGAVRPECVLDIEVPVVRALNIASIGDVQRSDWWPDLLILIDAVPRGDEPPGGTGRRLNPEVAAAVARHRAVLLAGGLGPDNVADAVRTIRPAGVDASSGLEAAPGVKDPELVRAYVRAARSAADG
jgi:phosphoribosylanthranilate isomerase